MTRIRHCLTICALLAAGACQSSVPIDNGELALAAAASDSLNLALADSLAPDHGFVATLQGASRETLSACKDDVDAQGWESVGSRIVEMELPPGFTSTGQTDQYANWQGPIGSIRVSSHSGSNHAGWWSDKITSECDVFISGFPAHVDLVTTPYARSVYATIHVRDAPAIEIEGQARNVAGQAMLLHSIRSARISAAWGRPMVYGVQI